MKRVLLALFALVLAAPAWGNEYRFGVFVGNDAGAPGDPELVFATSDAHKMYDLFIEYGKLRPGDAILLEDKTARAVQNAVESLGRRVQEVVNDGHEATFIFYYSGHGDDEALHMGATRVEHVNLRTWIERTGANRRIAMIDACQSGGITRKGGSRGQTFAFGSTDIESVEGTAILTSSAAGELAQESPEVGGGFFTHYLHTALSGGADLDRDGEVTLTEAYDYVHRETTFKTRDAPETQTPSFLNDTHGSGAIVLTTLEASTSNLAFLGDLTGAYSIWDEGRKRYVAEVNGAHPVHIAVRAGTFFVHQRLNGYVREARYQVRRGETLAVYDDDFETVSLLSVSSRGDLDKQVRRSKVPDLSLRFAMGVRGFGGDKGSEYVPGHAVGGLQARFLGKRTSYSGFEVLTGGGTGVVEIPDLEPIAATYATTSFSGVIGAATPPNLVRAGIGGRASFTVVQRSFEVWDRQEARGSIAPGLNTWLGVHHGRFSGDLEWNYNLLVMKWDESRGWPAYAELLLTMGYRF